MQELLPRRFSGVMVRPIQPGSPSKGGFVSLAKRSFDVVAGSVLLILSLPLMLLAAVGVALDGGPIFYLANLIGANGRQFKCIKFRTMFEGADDCLDEYLNYHQSEQLEWLQNCKLVFDPRVTPIGRFLKRTSIDELPQLINVLRGEMSLVGPRPVTQAELDKHYGLTAELYKTVRPGMTGLWQVNGRNDMSYATRVALDEKYIRQWALSLDVSILLRTCRVVLSRRGAR